MSKLKAKLLKEQNKINQLLKLQKQFPDLQEVTDRWQNIRYSSVHANNLCNKVEIRKSCGCCMGAAIYAYPYIEIDDIRIYSNPARIILGYGNEFTGLPIPSENINLAEYNLGAEAQKIIQDWVKENENNLDYDFEEDE